MQLGWLLSRLPPRGADATLGVVMNARVLISAIVQQVTVLIAQLATTGGARAPLAQVAGQVFLELARELEAQGVSRKVSAKRFSTDDEEVVRAVLHDLVQSGTRAARPLACSRKTPTSSAPRSRPLSKASSTEAFTLH